MNINLEVNTLESSIVLRTKTSVLEHGKEAINSITSPDYLMCLSLSHSAVRSR